ncbi:carbonic anhydrase [Vibrio maritimus]|uniref:Carbonic anhydrase n=1 Tax=Vibrio maritimus TaxID=990268 RepID=A0A090S186_9VIBR|nr:carbonic anhydrase [Vibrio maritimus]
MPEIKQLFDNNSKWSQEIKSERLSISPSLKKVRALAFCGSVVQIAVFQQSD